MWKLAERDVVHDGVHHPALQLDGGDLHEEGVLVAVELQQVVVQLGGDAFGIPAVQVTETKSFLSHYSEVTR